MPVRLTDTHCRGLPPNRELRDTIEPGLAIRRQTGAVSFVLVWQKDGKARRHTLGRYPDMSLAQAREEARRLRPALVSGSAPVAATLGELLDLYIATVGKSKDQARYFLDKHIRPTLGDMPLLTLHKRDLQATIDKIPSASVRGATGRYVSAAMRYGESRGHVDAAPRLALPPPGEIRQRVIGDLELKALLKDWLPNGLDAPGRSSLCTVFALLAFTGARLREIADLQRDEVDQAEGLIRLSAARSKGNRPTVVVLSSFAQRILAAVPMFDRRFYFPSEGRQGGAVSGFSRAKNDTLVRTGTADWTLHDLRRTLGTNLARAGVPPHIIEATLNHAAPKLARTYAVHHPVDEIRVALEAEGARLEALDPWGCTKLG